MRCRIARLCSKKNYKEPKGSRLFSVFANYCYVIKYLDDVIYWNDLEARDCCILMLGNFRNKGVAM